MKKTFLGLALVVLIGGAYSGLAGATSRASDLTPTLVEDTLQSTSGEQEIVKGRRIDTELFRGDEVRMSIPCLTECWQDLGDCMEDGNPVSVCKAILEACRESCA